MWHSVGAMLNPQSSVLYPQLIFLIGRSDEDHAAIRTWDSSFDEDEMIVGIQLDDGEISGGGPSVAVTPRAFVSELRSAAASIAGMRADTAGRPVVFLDAVAGRQTGEMMAFH